MNTAVLVSGGVDSSVALALLKEKGHSCTAFYLKIWLEDELSSLGTCPWEEDLSYVRALCKQFDVPLEIISCQRDYWDIVVAQTLSAIKEGKTPNPDMLCNAAVKFGAFQTIIGTNFSHIATGHYARIEFTNGEFHLYNSPDPIKDQTYFLSTLSQAQLSRAVFPIGHLTKSEVRQCAQNFNVPSKNRKDSQGICFLGKLKFSDFIRYHLGDKPGNLYEYETGKVLGEHKGFWYYTIGQRQGIGLSGGPWYVVAKDSETNSIFISRHYYDAEKHRNKVKLASFNWIGKEMISPSSCSVKLRHGPERHNAFFEGTMVTLDHNDQGIAPGQYAVLYEGDRCRGSAIIQA